MDAVGLCTVGRDSKAEADPGFPLGWTSTSQGWGGATFRKLVCQKNIGSLRGACQVHPPQGGGLNRVCPLGAVAHIVAKGSTTKCYQCA